MLSGAEAARFGLVVPKGETYGSNTCEDNAGEAEVQKKSKKKILNKNFKKV